MEPLDPRAAARLDPAKLAKVNLFDSPRMFLDVYGLLPGQEQKPHRHDAADKVYVALDGEGIVRIGDREHPLRAGEVVVCPAGADHGVRNAGPLPMRLLVMMTKA